MTDKKGLYIHIPFCDRKCNYCDFTSFAGKTQFAEEYCNKLVSELGGYEKYDVDTIYIGGGTPSAIESYYVCKVLDFATDHFNVDNDAEITIEINPASALDSKLKDYKSAGVNRISMGAQSFNDDELIALGRLHNADDVRRAYDSVRRFGFENVSLDLMFGLPDQTMGKLGYSISEMLKLAPEHISCYGLKIEEGTPFYNMMAKGEITPVGDDTFADFYDYIRSEFECSGYVQYEISNFGKPGYHSRHNCRYWQCDEYIGAGLGASSYLNGIRSKNTGSLLSYNNETEEVLSKEDKMREFVIFGLRMTHSGISVSEFKKRFGVDIYDVFEKQLKKHQTFITRDADVLKLKREAYYICNAVLSDFLL